MSADWTGAVTWSNTTFTCHDVMNSALQCGHVKCLFYLTDFFLHRHIKFKRTSRSFNAHRLHLMLVWSKCSSHTFVRRSSSALRLHPHSAFISCFYLHHVQTRPGPDSSQSDRRTNRKRKEHLHVCLLFCTEIILIQSGRTVSAQIKSASHCRVEHGQCSFTVTATSLPAPPVLSRK